MSVVGKSIPQVAFGIVCPGTLIICLSEAGIGVERGVVMCDGRVYFAPGIQSFPSFNWDIAGADAEICAQATAIEKAIAASAAKQRLIGTSSATDSEASMSV